MDNVAAGFWGAFFCTAALMLAMSLAAYVRLHKRVALMAALTAFFSSSFAIAYLGWLPLSGAAEARVLAHLAVVTAVALGLMLMSTLGLLRVRTMNRRAVAALLGAGVLVLAAGWALEARAALALSSVLAFGVGSCMLAVAVRGAREGERAGWTAVAALCFMLVAIAGLSVIALGHSRAWPVHAVSALAGIAYLCVIASVLWARYSYLLELSEVLAHGPGYDPVTRMRSHSETGQLVGDVFFRREGGPRPVGVVAICIANLYALENLHGRAAFNHALFICAGRLRRCVPQNVDMGRLGDDGFLLLLRNGADMERMGRLARAVRDRMSRPVALSTSRDVPGLEAAGTAWVAEIGIGVLGTTTDVRPSQAVSTARAMARTAWSYGSRLAFYDQEAGRIAELPREEGAAVPATA